MGRTVRLGPRWQDEPDEKALRDFTIMNIIFEDGENGGGGNGGGCLIPFTVMVGLSGSAIAGMIYGAVQLIMHLRTI